MTSFINNDVASGAIVRASDHNTQGASLAAVINGNIDSGNLADSSVTTSKISDGSVTNAKLSTTAGQPGGAWQSWTPTWTNLTIGNGTVTAKYIQVGKRITFRIELTFGSTTSASGLISFTVPITANSEMATTANEGMVFGQARFLDAATAAYLGFLEFLANDPTKASGVVFNTAGTYAGAAGWAHNVPFTFGNGDKFMAVGTYEAV